MRRSPIIRRLLKPAGRLVLGDILRPEVGMAQRRAARCCALRRSTAS